MDQWHAQYLESFHYKIFAERIVWKIYVLL